MQKKPSNVSIENVSKPEIDEKEKVLDEQRKMFEDMIAQGNSIFKVGVNFIINFR